MTDALGRALRENDYLAQEVARIDAEVAAMKQANSQAIAAAVEDGIMRAVSNPALWAAAAAAMRNRAQSAAGGVLFGGVRGVASKLAWVLAGLLAVYALGGWSAVVAVTKTLIHAPGAGQ